MFHLYESKMLFRGKQDGGSGEVSDEPHLAELVSLMGPPPKSFFARSTLFKQVWGCGWQLGRRDAHP